MSSDVLDDTNQNDNASKISSGEEARGTNNKSSNNDKSNDSSVSPFLQYKERVRNRLDRLQRQNYYIVLLCSVLATALIVSTIVNLWVSSVNRVEPFYVAIDEESGEVIRTGTPEKLQGLSQPVVEAQIRQIIRGLRAVYVDQRATRQSYREAFARIKPSSKAEEFIIETLNVRSQEESKAPPQLVENIQRTISRFEITRVQGTRTYNIRWVERELNSGSITEKSFAGSISTTRVKKESKEALKKNPLGFYADGLTWKQTSSELMDEGKNR